MQRKGSISHPLMRAVWLKFTCLSPICLVNRLLSLRSRWCRGKRCSSLREKVWRKICNSNRYCNGSTLKACLHTNQSPSRTCLVKWNMKVYSNLMEPMRNWYVNTVVKSVYYYMSRTHFRVNVLSIVAWMSMNCFLETGAISET